MSGADRCDEIMRMIDEVLGVDPQEPTVSKVAFAAIDPVLEPLAEPTEPTMSLVPQLN